MRPSLMIIMVCFVFVFTFWGQLVEGSTRKLPFNGSIFGKRSNPGTGKHAASPNFQLLCDAAMNACSDWLPIGSK
ncbi:putative SIFamide preprohormone [Daphnia sinensis]|uniref:SIFamide preprohormone n=1 Tax=Daphnia sinensis TaxID=1820382 RepID=A0AAD5KW03_9CRUS|nr:putative SIFamide preprohormone [Daphnia sinensis]